jgi:hypothetical protein
VAVAGGGPGCVCHPHPHVCIGASLHASRLVHVMLHASRVLLSELVLMARRSTTGRAALRIVDSEAFDGKQDRQMICIVGCVFCAAL